MLRNENKILVGPPITENNPDLLEPGGAPIPGSIGRKEVREMLSEASDAIENKWKSMTDPVWALADMVLIKTLLQTSDVEKWEALLKDNAKQQRLVEASEKGDPEGVERASRQLDGTLKFCAKNVSEKYIAPPATTDFGILFLSTAKSRLDSHCAIPITRDGHGRA